MLRRVPITHDVSDGGAGVRAMRHRLGNRCDNAPGHELLLIAARRKVMRNCRRLLDVFDAIVRNGSNRRESIGELAKRGKTSLSHAKLRYFRARNKLMKLFNVTKGN